MSLFEDPNYRWRETYFVLFPIENRPEKEHTDAFLQRMSKQFEVADTRYDDQGRVESFTLFSPEDSAAMDVTYVAGEDVIMQVGELINDLQVETEEEKQQAGRLHECTARFEIYHFERSSADEDDGLDPGTLFVLMEDLAKCCQGIGIDPQSGTLIG